MAEKTWFEAVFRRPAHPLLRLLGNLLGCAGQVWCVVFTVTESHGGWRWLPVPLFLLTLAGHLLGVTLAWRDLRGRGAEPLSE